MADTHEFHLLTRPRSGWLALGELALVAVFFTVFQFAIVMAFGIAQPELLMENVTSDAAGLFDVFVIALALPAPFLAARICGRNPAELVSVARRFRWDVVGRALIVVLPVYAVVMLVNALSGDLTLTPQTLVTAAMFVLVVPIQAATEEFVFRGALPQIFGTWFRSPWVAYGLAVLPFVLLHIYNFAGLVNIAVVAVCFAYLTWRSGGLEQAIVLHAVANTSVFVMQALRPDEVVSTDIPWTTVGLDVALTIALTAAISYFGKDVVQRQEQPA